MYIRVHEHSEWFSNDAFPSAVVLAPPEGRLWFGDRRTTLKDRRKEIGKGLIKAMCNQLGIDPDEL